MAYWYDGAALAATNSPVIALFWCLIKFTTTTTTTTTILYLEEIHRKLNELNLFLQNQDMNIVRVKQIRKAFMSKLVIWKMIAMTHNF